VEQKAFLDVLEENNKLYDFDVKLLKEPFSSPGYHTQYKGSTVHKTYTSAVYALALLDAGEYAGKAYNGRACGIIDKIVSLQDTCPDSPTFGIWPWFYEEPLVDMNPPDWNWADFLGKELLQIAVDYPDALGKERLERVINAINCACRSIIRREVTISYTNIAVMDSIVTIMAGEYFNEPEFFNFFNYGKNKIRKIREHTAVNGLTEYNSPTYTTIVLRDISTALQYVKDVECIEDFKFIRDAAWKCAGEHWFYNLSEWAGPHARAYSSFLSDELRSSIMYSVGGKDFLRDIGLAFFRTDLKCPEEYKHYFNVQGETREIRYDFCQNIPGDEHVQSAPALSACCYISDKFSLGSFNESLMWNQRRNLIAHYGTAGNPRYLNLRCLNGGYDFCAAAVNVVQSRGNALIIVSFDPKGGNTHPNLDKLKDGFAEIEDLRISFEIGGCEGFPVWENGKTAFCDGGLKFEITNPKTVFGENEIYYEANQNAGITNLDIVLYHGEKRVWKLDELKAFAVFTLSITIDVEK
jgi:hypothetical protein